MRVETFTVDQVIIHEITARQRAPHATPAELLLSEVVSPLDDELKEYFETRIIENSKEGPFPIVVDQEIESPVPAAVFRQLTNRRADFVGTSKVLGEHLFKSQEKVASSPGLLVVVEGTVDTGSCLALLKLQKQEGVRLERTGRRGARTYSVEHLRQLMLTNETRVFKIALFPSDDLNEVGDLHGIVSDKQRPYRPDKQVADFFLQTFLGCQVRDNPAKTTSAFFTSTEKFINAEVADIHDRTQYHRALLAELTSQDTMIDPRRFADRHFAERDRPRYLAYLRDQGVATRRFDKNVELIASRLREREYVLEDGLKVRGPDKAWEEHVAESRTDDNRLELLIQARLEAIRGR